MNNNDNHETNNPLPGEPASPNHGTTEAAATTADLPEDRAHGPSTPTDANPGDATVPANEAGAARESAPVDAGEAPSASDPAATPAAAAEATATPAPGTDAAPSSEPPLSATTGQALLRVIKSIRADVAADALASAAAATAPGTGTNRPADTVATHEGDADTTGNNTVLNPPTGAAVDGEPPLPPADAAAAEEPVLAVDTGPLPEATPDLMQAALEGLLFVANRPMTAEKLAALLNIDKDEVLLEINKLKHRLESDPCHGLQVITTESGVQLATKAMIAPYLTRLEGQRLVNLSLPALETLSIIALKQPVTRGEIEHIRGVNSDGTVATLLEKKLINVVGEKPVPGRPRLYGTTQDFLYYFGLESLAEMPIPPDEPPSTEDLEHAKRAADGVSMTTALEGMGGVPLPEIPEIDAVPAPNAPVADIDAVPGTPDPEPTS